jgi:SAM-dependent methyltransferase
MTLLQPPDTDPLARLFAGGLHARLLVLGRPPGTIELPVDRFERVACLATTDADIRPGTVRADPHHLPFHEALFDKALWSCPLVQPRLMLRELWRVLAPAGLAVLIVRARRPWHGLSHGWLREPLALRLDEAMFEVLDWQVQTLPDRHHVVLVGKRDGLKPMMIGRVESSEIAATAH